MADEEQKVQDTADQDVKRILCRVSYYYKGKVRVIQSVCEGETIKETHSLRSTADIEGITINIPSDGKALPKYTIEGKDKLDWCTRPLENEKKRGKQEKFDENTEVKESNVNVYPNLCTNDGENDYNTENHYGLKENGWRPIIGPYCPTRTDLYKCDLLKDSEVSPKRGKSGERAEFTADQKTKIFNENWNRSLNKTNDGEKEADEALYYKSPTDYGYKLVTLKEFVKLKNTDDNQNIIDSKNNATAHYVITENEYGSRVVQLYTRKPTNCDNNELTTIDKTRVDSEKIKVYKSDYDELTLFYKKYYKNLRNGRTNKGNETKKYVYKENEMCLVAGVRPKKRETGDGFITPANEAQIDHIHPTVWGGEGGSNSYCNAAVVSRLINAKKSNDAYYKK